MAIKKDPELTSLLKRANKRLAILEKNKEKTIYKKSTENLVNRMLRVSEELTGGQTKHLARGNIKQSDVESYKEALRRFLRSEMSTLRGQKKVMRENKAAFEGEFGKISDEDYMTLTHVLESDEFARFKEKYGTYAGVLNDMVANPIKSYDDAINFIKSVNEDDSGTYFTKTGALNTKAFIDGWRAAR